MSMGPNLDFVEAKAWFTASRSTMSATNVRIETPGCWDSTSCFVERREDDVRPRMAIFVAPDFAKAWVIRGPIPDPPPVMRITLPTVESSGREGSMEG